ncbi:transcription regulator [Natronococcus amylolyticus DSM 10524]|uniref:Transcription regulator n=1 Tax=Natronococcus amylolyticus DSM 10524 TaxID=1227497 RepID=L9WYT6_9EURY|nr:AbrB/MazE/SpoVT family DNA-binding domain-containing protein [Natronococcus amylolyticus]ELY54639.1 transcription regulator [Natronococcus amylolyticus DSM 10524]
MPTVDSKGRIVLPKEVRERFDIEPGTEVEVSTEDGKVVVEPETDPEVVLERLDALVEEATADRTRRDYEDLDALARDHAETIRRQAQRVDDDGE